MTYKQDYTGRQPSDLGQPNDLTLNGPAGREGNTLEYRRYGYWPDGTKDSWVILCTVLGAKGPYIEVRNVQVSPYAPDSKDPFNGEPQR